MRRSRRTRGDCSSSSNGPKAPRIHAESDTEGCERAGQCVRVSVSVCACSNMRTKSARFPSCMCELAVLSDAEMPWSQSHT